MRRTTFKKFLKRKRTFRKRRTSSRRPAARPRRMVQNNVYSFKRLLSNGGQIVGNVAYAPFVSGTTFTLSQLVNVSEFSNLFDQYRITFIVAKYWLKIDPSAQSATGASYPKLYWYRDYDDSGVPSNLNEMRENGKCRVAVMYPNRPVTIAFKPNVLNNVWNNALASATQTPVWNVWLDMANTNTSHYGYKIAIDDLTNTNYKVDVEFLYYFQCKSVR